MTLSNADGLSRRPCDNSSCRYCLNVESKYEVGNSVGRIIFEEIAQSDWRNHENQDDDIRAILKSKKEGVNLSWQDISSGDEYMKVYLSQYDSLVVLDGILYREWISSNFKTKVIQLVVPRNYVNIVLEEAHDSPSGGHFHVNKTIQKIRK